MAYVPNINQKAASTSFKRIHLGESPSVKKQVALASGFSYNAMGSLIGTPVASPGSSFFLFNATDATQMLWGITFDTYSNSVDLAGSLTPISMTGNISTATGQILNSSGVITPVVGNIAGSNGATPSLARSVITGLNINANNLVLGASISGTGIPSGSTIVQVLSSSAIVISGNVTATTTGVALTTYPVTAANSLVTVATTQGNSTEWIQNQLVGVNGTADIATYITANPSLARSYPNYSGSQVFNVVSFNFLGGK